MSRNTSIEQLKIKQSTEPNENNIVITDTSTNGKLIQKLADVLALCEACEGTVLLDAWLKIRSAFGPRLRTQGRIGGPHIKNI